MDQATPQAAPEDIFPRAFVIKMTFDQRQGYGLFRWTDGGLDQAGNTIHVIHRHTHGELYYNVRTLNPQDINTVWREVETRKSNGTVSRSMRWRFTRDYLINERGEDVRRYPVIEITSPSSTLVPCRAVTFIPIVNNPAAVPVPLQQAAQQAALEQLIDEYPVPHTGQHPALQPPKIYTIATIPQHAVRAFLRDAAMQQETCSITGEEIDVTNGAMTSCFHIFEKNAIATWLAMPNSRDKCPVCNCKCNSFTVV